MRSTFLEFTTKSELAYNPSVGACAAMRGTAELNIFRIRQYLHQIRQDDFVNYIEKKLSFLSRLSEIRVKMTSWT